MNPDNSTTETRHLRIAVYPNHGDYGVDEFRLGEYLTEYFGWGFAERTDAADYQTYLKLIFLAQQAQDFSWPPSEAAPFPTRQISNLLGEFYAECDRALRDLFTAPGGEFDLLRIRFLGRRDRWDDFPDVEGGI